MFRNKSVIEQPSHTKSSTAANRLSIRFKNALAYQRESEQQQQKQMSHISHQTNN